MEQATRNSFARRLRKFCHQAKGNSQFIELEVRTEEGDCAKRAGIARNLHYLNARLSQWSLSFGLFRSYLHRPSYDPDAVVTAKDLRHLEMSNPAGPGCSGSNPNPSANIWLMPLGTLTIIY